MKSLGVRLTMWYAMAATSTLVCLFLLGYEQLRAHLIHGLDMLNAAEFEQIRSRLGDDYRALTPTEIRARVGETADSGTVLFYTQIRAWRVSAEDEGSGIPVEKRESVFERFVRLDNRGANDRGSGLGLATRRSIIELHQGQIWAEAGQDGRGSGSYSRYPVRNRRFRCGKGALARRLLRLQSHSHAERRFAI